MTRKYAVKYQYVSSFFLQVYASTYAIVLYLKFHKHFFFFFFCRRTVFECVGELSPILSVNCLQITCRNPTLICGTCGNILEAQQTIYIWDLNTSSLQQVFFVVVFWEKKANNNK